MYLGGCLLTAVRNGDEKETAYWIRAGRSCGVAVAMDIKTGKSTLHYAAEGGHLKICNMLIEADASPMNIDKYGKTPIHLAIIHGHLQVVNYLLTFVKVPAEKSQRSSFHKIMI
jgi:hypothetical protein